MGCEWWAGRQAFGRQVASEAERAAAATARTRDLEETLRLSTIKIGEVTTHRRPCVTGLWLKPLRQRTLCTLRHYSHKRREQRS